MLSQLIAREQGEGALNSLPEEREEKGRAWGVGVESGGAAGAAEDCPTFLHESSIFTADTFFLRN